MDDIAEINPSYLYTIDEAGRFCGCGRDQVYKLLGLGELEAVKTGIGLKATRVKGRSIIRYREKLPKYDGPTYEKRREHFSEMRKKGAPEAA